MGGATRFLMLLTSTTTPPLLHHRYPALIRFSRHRTLVPSSVSCLSHDHYHHLPSSISPSLPRPSKIKASQQLHSQTASTPVTDSNPSSFSSPLASQAWPEWSNFINNLSAAGYFNRQRFGINLNEEFVAGLNLPEHFVMASSACLTFACERPDLLGMLSRSDIEVVVEKGMPFLFRNGDDSVRRMRSFLGSAYSNNTDRAHTIDLVRFLLSYASNFISSEKNIPSNGELVESSVRNLLNELAQLSYAPETNLSGSLQNQYSDRYGQPPRSPGAPEMNLSGSVQNPDRCVPAPRPNGQNVEMKRGDWVCTRCSFMNFARNMKCLECQEARPKRQLTGGEWECPQCDFFNYGRNTVCLRCDCQRPGEVSFGTNNSLGYGQGSNAGKVPVDARLAANEEKAQRWFSKISQLDSNSDMSSAIADEDFPEIMPLRKGVNRFVVSTRKTPLERRLDNSQYQRNLGDASGSSSSNLNPNQSFDQSLQNAGTDTASSTPPGAPRGSNYIPFVPLPADMFANKPDESNINQGGKVEIKNNKSLASTPVEQRDAVSGSNEYSNSSANWQSFEDPNQNLSNQKEEQEQAEKSERWFKRVAELHNVTDLPSAIPDEDFPEIMPMRKGENKFVVSKRKDRSLTSPVYKRRVAMEQANDTNFVPFVPFPPNYFAQKDNQQRPEADSTNNSAGGTSNSATSEELPHNSASKPGVSMGGHAQGMGNQNYNTGSNGSRAWEENRNTEGACLTGEHSTQNVIDPQPTGRDSWRNGQSSRDNFSRKPNMVRNSHQNITETPRSGKDSGRNGFSTKEETDGAASFSGTTSENQNVRGSWSGKSLEGSAVKETDPLDMSEEAKAERWFRRVAQIKDISELSEIPDEDFPSIMPMRKGVNRFVVSKRKTPLERRLTSTQYRRNLPIMSSDPVKENDSN
ncbi:zinc finger protein VAR3, chloroplastic [Euphorbia lathyris]|uniref:zinc finger protein VAR3, chloroplastic n=1 Tax=Euphorbia lathyris TaxID=212925 RepID=UPI0033139769